MTLDRWGGGRLVGDETVGIASHARAKSTNDDTVRKGTLGFSTIIIAIDPTSSDGQYPYDVMEAGPGGK